ncbi:hypothetical protein HW555_014415, partial [Spodoptera exigua]
TLTSIALPSTVIADEYDTKIDQQTEIINGLKTKESEAAAKLATIESDMLATAAKIDELSDKKDELTKEIKALYNEISDLNVRIQKREVQMRNQARDVQVSGASTSYLDVIVNSESIADAISRVQGISTLVSANNDLLKQQNTDKEDVEKKSDNVETQISVLETSEKELTRQQDALKTLKIEQEVAKNELEAQPLTSVSLPSVVSADEVDSKIQQKDQAISGLKSQEADAQSKVATVQNQVASINEKAQTLLTQQTELRKTSTNLENEISQLKTRIEKREVAIQSQARDVQVNGDSTSYMDAILNAKSVSDAITRVTAMSTIVKANNDLVKQQQEDKEAVEDKKAENETKIQELQENQVTLEAQKGDLVKAEAELKVLQTTLAAERATAEDQKAGLVQEKEAAEAERARIAEQEK